MQARGTPSEEQNRKASDESKATLENRRGNLGMPTESMLNILKSYNINLNRPK